MSAPVWLMLPVPAAMVPPLGSAVGGKTVCGGAGGINAIGGTAIGGRAVGGAAKAGAQNAVMQNVVMIALTVGHTNFTPCVLRRERSYFWRSDSFKSSIPVASIRHAKTLGSIPAGWRIAAHEGGVE
jgi:hypothetical protein